MATIKKAQEYSVSSDNKFPRASCENLIARKWGSDAVALSGPDEGQPLVKCVCDQLEKRYDSLKERFSKNTNNKIEKIAIKLADSFSQNDDTAVAVDEIRKLGLNKKAAKIIALDLKAFAIDNALEGEINNMADSIDKEDDSKPDFGGHGKDKSPFEKKDETTSDEGEKLDSPTEEVVKDDGAGDEEVEEVTEFPSEDGNNDNGGDEGHQDFEIVVDEPESPMGGMPEEMNHIDQLSQPQNDDFITIDIPMEVANSIIDSMQEKMMNGGKPEIEEVSEMSPEGMGMGAPEASPMPFGDEGSKPEALETPMDEAMESPETQAHEQAEGTEMHEVPGEPKDMQNDNDQVVVGDDMGGAGAGGGIPSASEPSMNIAALLSSNRISRVGQSVLKLGPEMSINNTDQLAGHETKKLGPAKMKAVEAPKKLEDNVKVDANGYSANGTKFQDGGTLGNEKKFDAHKLSKDEVSKGKASLMGKDEELPSNKPEVPAGSKPIGGETLEGGDVSTNNGTMVTATFTPNGLKVEANGKAFLAKIKLSSAPSDAVKAAVSSINFDGDAKKFASDALKAIKVAMEDEKTHATDNSKLEGEHFQNDADKAPEKDVKHKTKTMKDSKEPTTDNSKLEGKNFQNETEHCDAASSSKANVKVADKAVEAPKPLEDNVDTEGYSAGDKKFQDGGTLGNEEKFDAKEINKSDVAKGKTMTPDESLPKDGPEVPVGGKLPHDEFTGNNVSTLGTVHASDQSAVIEKRVREEMANEYKVREARLKAASVYVADLLKNGDIKESEYATEHNKCAEMSVQEIQRLAASTRAARERVAKTASNQVSKKNTEVKEASLSFPVISPSNNSETLKDNLMKNMQLTKNIQFANNAKDFSR